MSLWVKICANTSVADAQMAVNVGADAVGFVFASSPRRVTREQVAAITPHLPAAIEKIGVFVDSDFATIAETVALAGLTGVQLHSSNEGDLAAQLRARFGPSLRILQVVHFGKDASAELQAVSANGFIDAVLIDSRTVNAVGGTGIPFDWQTARATVFDGACALKLIAAGGLTPANVAEAITTLQPWGVDVASGVESSPGHKDEQKVRSFVANARAASAQQ
ncbi:phosphoribosylanthranilate isomerase [Acidicapsa acidisoli]|uniref:phosphoribosylanthranilate isomerase n=1 Tax=Acidicapsa acidisoli TaxID=1615681 RepID=UPI0021E09AE6|nr:phosphoribosylanthranilate isomerase [Acidicapsa acidisoli]